ncbi:MRN complex-interacting protein isoform X2 [Pogoniulus pusillus]|uniref:MRN complex-interacting protein isoform X2 n=1 Tax=Pogoniulus pusillus TaxID=488313 RepID=UPI0030B94146
MAAAAAAGGGLAPPFWVLRCCSCRRFQVQQIYGQGSGRDCRHHVQKLNLLQGEAEEAAGWTSWGREDFVKDSNNTAPQSEDSLVQQEGRAEVSRWSKYLDKDSEDEEEEEATSERQQFCSWRKNTVEGQRKHQKGFLSDVQEHAEEYEVFQLASQSKKRRKCLLAVPDRDDGDALSEDRAVPAVCESVVPKETTPTPSACTKPSKWDKFLSYSDSSSDHAARATLSPQEGSEKLGLHSTTAADVASRCAEQRGRALIPGTSFQFKECGVSTQQLASNLPGTSCSVEEDALCKEPQSQLLRAGPGDVESSAERCTSRPKLSSVSCKQFFCIGDEFDDDL